MKSVKANNQSPTPSENNVAGLPIVDVVIERLIISTRKQWFPSDCRPAPTTDLHHESDAKASAGNATLVGFFPVFSDCGHQRSGRHPGLYTGATAAFGLCPALHTHILQTSV